MGRGNTFECNIKAMLNFNNTGNSKNTNKNIQVTFKVKIDQNFIHYSVKVPLKSETAINSETLIFTTCSLKYFI